MPSSKIGCICSNLISGIRSKNNMKSIKTIQGKKIDAVRLMTSNPKRTPIMLVNKKRTMIISIGVPTKICVVEKLPISYNKADKRYKI